MTLQICKEDQQLKRQDDLVAECLRMIDAGQRVEAVRLYRKETGAGLDPAMRALGLR